MKRSSIVLFAACLAGMGDAAELAPVTAAEGAVVTRNLVSVRASEDVMAASWTMAPDSYTLQLVIDPSKRLARLKAINEANKAANEQKAANQAPQPAIVANAAGATGTANTLDRSSFFIGNTIANLRGLDPAFCGRTLTLVDGRRTVAGQQPAPAPAQVKQAAREVKMPTVEVWLLKSDGTNIRPASYSCIPGSKVSPERRDMEISYRFAVADSAQAVAAAIRINDEFFIEKLQQFEPGPAAR